MQKKISTPTKSTATIEQLQVSLTRIMQDVLSGRLSPKEANAQRRVIERQIDAWMAKGGARQ